MTSQNSTKATDTRPREGLPPCWRGVSRFDDREATWHDSGRCPVRELEPKFHTILAATYRSYIEGFFQQKTDCSGGLVADGYIKGQPAVFVETDDPAKAKVAWVRAEHWVRTEELP